MGTQTLAFHFPETVNEKAARVVAGFVFLFGVTALVTQWVWLPVVMALGFALRVGWGPRFSPLGRLASGVIAPRLGAPRPVAGAPKRFAQAVGLTVTTVAGVAALAGIQVLASGLLGVLVVFAALEAGVGFCAGCWAYGHLARAGFVAADRCVDCADLPGRADRLASPS